MLAEKQQQGKLRQEIRFPESQASQEGTRVQPCLEGELSCPVGSPQVLPFASVALIGSLSFTKKGILISTPFRDGGHLHGDRDHGICFACHDTPDDQLSAHHLVGAAQCCLNT